MKILSDKFVKSLLCLLFINSSFKKCNKNVKLRERKNQYLIVVHAMKVNENILNFYDLYSNDDSVVYRAVLKKKDWMFRRLFIPCNFHSLTIDNIVTYPDLFGLMDQGFVFQELHLDESKFEGHEKKIKKIVSEFNKRFKIRYAYEQIVPMDDSSTFWVEMDFTKLDNKTYNDLVCNFYPCISSIDEMDLFYDETKDIDLLKYPMIGDSRKWVFIIDQHLLVNNRFYMQNCFKKFWYNSHLLSDEQIEAIKEIAEANLVEAGDYYGK